MIGWKKWFNDSNGCVQDHLIAVFNQWFKIYLLVRVKNNAYQNGSNCLNNQKSSKHTYSGSGVRGAKGVVDRGFEKFMVRVVQARNENSE